MTYDDDDTISTERPRGKAWPPRGLWKWNVPVSVLPGTFFTKRDLSSKIFSKRKYTEYANPVKITIYAQICKAICRYLLVYPLNICRKIFIDRLLSMFTSLYERLWGNVLHRIWLAHMALLLRRSVWQICHWYMDEHISDSMMDQIWMNSSDNLVKLVTGAEYTHRDIFTDFPVLLRTTSGFRCTGAEWPYNHVSLYCVLLLHEC